MKYYELDSEEIEELEAIEDALENGELKSAPDLEKRKQELQTVAKSAFNITRNMTGDFEVSNNY